MRPSRWRIRAGGILLLATALTSHMFVAYAGDPEIISIQSVLAQASSYHLRSVTLEGVVRGIQVMPPIQASFVRGGTGCVLYGQAIFSLDDGTTHIPVEVRGSCFPQAVEMLPKDGDRVRLTAIIHLLTTNLPVHVRAQATEIVIVGS